MKFQNLHPYLGLLLWAARVSGLQVLPPQPLHFRYLGCYVDGDNSNRDLVGLQGVTRLGPYLTSSDTPAYVRNDTNLTLEMCSRICSYGRFRYFGAEARAYCGCDSTFGSHGAAAEADCDSKCFGNESQVCGGYPRLSIYGNIYPACESLSLVLDRIGLQLGPHLMKLSGPEVPVISAAPSVITHLNVTATSQIECAAACHRSPDCLACAFVKPSRTCRLMRFAAVPAEVASEADGVWIKL